MVYEDVEIQERLTPKVAEIHERKQRILRLRSQGYTEQQIAEKFEVSPKTISRAIKEIKDESLQWMNNLPGGEIQLFHKNIFETYGKIKAELWEMYENWKDENEN